MSEFTFSCPACGRNILSETTQAGTQIVCPGCNTTIAVPEETAGTASVSTPTSAPSALPGNTATTVQRTSGLAIASLICSLSSLITCVGWLPGIICGHLAKSRMRRNPSLKGSGLATAGLVIGYVIVMLEASTAAVQMWRLSTAVKQGYENVRQNLATNNLMVTQTQSTIVSNEVQPPEPSAPVTVAADNRQIESGQSDWTADLSTVSFPEHPVRGKLHGIDFAARTTSFRNGDLRFRSADGMQLDVYRLGASIEGQRYEIQPADDGKSNPRVKLTWNEGGVIQTATFSQGYGMKLQFDQAVNRKVSGKIYLCLPDEAKSCVAGTFEVRLPKQQ